MITLITGSPGGGKSLYVVSKLIPDYLKQGRKVFTNLIGLSYEKVNDDGSFTNLVPTLNNVPVSDLLHALPDSYDWRDCPKGSVIIYDEAQQFFPTSGRAGLSSDGRIVDLDTHRHNGYDILFISQHPTLISSHIRKFVGLHYHLYRKWGATYSSLYIWNHCNSSPENEIGEEQRADKRLFRFPTKAYKYYKSSEIHTHKFRIPKKAIYLLLGFLFILGSLSFLAYVSFVNISKVYRGDHLSPSYTKQLNHYIGNGSGEPIKKVDYPSLFARPVVD